MLHQRKQLCSPRAENPGNILLTSRNPLKYFHQYNVNVPHPEELFTRFNQQCLLKYEVFLNIFKISLLRWKVFATYVHEF